MYGFQRPYAEPGQVIGLFGGSFDPPHEGHTLVTRRAFRRLGLDQVWWLFSPGNPLKTHQPAPMPKRLAAAEAQLQHPRVVFSDIEARLNTRFSADTIAKLQMLYPHNRFVWIMGADNLAQFHRWERWQWIFYALPIAVMARPGEQLKAGLSPTAKRFARYRVPLWQAKALGNKPCPAWVMLPGASIDRSSTAIRAKGVWP